MKGWKQRLAAALSALMLVSALPVTALADEWRDKASPGSEVIYNLGTAEVTVGSDPKKAENAGTSYALFDEKGNYTLELEPDAFFPYEVQFTYGGDTWTEWFMDPADTVKVGGHTFSVESAVSDPEALTALSFKVGGKTVTAYPAKKEFTNNESSIAPQSLMPLKEFHLTVSMQGLLPEELKSVAVSAVLSGMRNVNSGIPEVKDTDVMIWSKGYNTDDFTVTPQDGTMDLSSAYSYQSYEYITLIVGSGHQLDLNSTRYLLDVQITNADDMLAVTARTADGKTAIDVYDTYFYTDRNGNVEKDVFHISVDKSQWQSGQKALLNMSLVDAFSSASLSATVYKGYYETAEAAEAAKAEDITAAIWGSGAPGLEGDYSYQRGYTGMPEITLVLKRQDVVAYVKPMVLYMYGAGMSLNMGDLRSEDGKDYIRSSSRYDWDNGMETCSITLKRGYPANGQYYLNLNMRNPADSSWTNYGIDNVKHAALGNFTTAEAIQAQPDIKDTLFSSPGYQADYSGGVIFSVLDVKGDIHQLKIVTIAASEDLLPSEPQPDSVDTYFQMQGAGSDADSGYLTSYVMSYKDDGYYYNGYQTVFLLHRNNDGTYTPATDETIRPYFYTGSLVTMYAGIDHTSGVMQKSGETSVAFHNGEVIQYSAAAESKGHLKNYWVTFLTQQTGGPKLFVNAANDPDRVDEDTGLPVREIYLTDDYDFHHDVFFANIGDQEMKHLYVRLENAENVALDSYWTIREDAPESAKTLGAFTTTETRDADGEYVSYGELKNVAKVRLVPAENSMGIISGTLVIGYQNDDGTTAEEVKIKLTGTSGTPKITTDTLSDGVKYVPYNSVIMTNSMGASDAIAFSVTDGALPDGVELYPNGKLYGMPKNAGTYTFTVTAVYNGNETLSDSKTFTIVIKDNTNANVDASTDPGYDVLDRLPDTVTGYTDQVFRSKGAFGYFYKFYLDGQELVLGQDYIVEEGSTKITIRAQTFRNKGTGTHTIAAEFRTDKNDTNTVKTAAQNYTIYGGSASGGSTKPADKPTTPVDPTTAAGVFKDVSTRDWFYADVDWTYQNKLMIGVSSDLYDPYGLISFATVVTVLARMDQVDLSRYDGITYPEITPGQWYTNAAIWAKETNLLPEGSFSAVPPVARAEFAVMLVKYFQNKGIDCTLTGDPVSFADADQMTPEVNNAFQVLYQFGIFKGIGDYHMDPQGSTTRAQLATLLHRISVFTESHIS